MSEQTRFLLSENDLPKFWYNINADSPVRAQPGVEPVDQRTGDAGFPVSAVPDGTDPAGDQHRTLYPDPG